MGLPLLQLLLATLSYVLPSFPLAPIHVVVFPSMPSGAPMFALHRCRHGACARTALCSSPVGRVNVGPKDKARHYKRCACEKKLYRHYATLLGSVSSSSMCMPAPLHSSGRRLAQALSWIAAECQRCIPAMMKAAAAEYWWLCIRGPSLCTVLSSCKEEG